MSLRYPADRPQGEADFVSFQHMEYSSRGGSGGGGGGGGGIVLYMPAPAPAVSNVNSWTSSDEKFMGPIGQFKRGVADELSGLVNADDFNLERLGNRANNAVERFKGTKIGPMARQAGMNLAGDLTNMTAQQIMSVTRGEIYNPNVEMFYNGPKLRDFTFNFKMTPKSSSDAQAIMNIIREFKTWSAPEEQGQKFKIPHVWKVSYGGAAANYYNKFKPAALVNVNVQFNPGLDGHMTFIDGCPVVSSLILSFKEVELVTRKDHSSGSGM